MERAHKYLEEIGENDEDITREHVKHVFDLISKYIDSEDEINEIWGSRRRVLPIFKAHMLALLCKWVSGVFQKIHENYQEKYGIAALLQKYKSEFRALFYNIARDEENEKIAADMLFEKLKFPIQEEVEGKVFDGILKEIAGKYNKSGILKNLFQDIMKGKHEEIFSEFTAYFQNPQGSAEEWFKESCMKQYQERYKAHAKHRIDQLLKETSEKCKEMMSEKGHPQEIIEKFCADLVDIIPIEKKETEEIARYNISDTQKFGNNLLTRLENELEKEALLREVVKKKSLLSLIRPLQNMFKNKWGCTEVCPSCGEPCMWPQNDHWEKEGDPPHFTIQHRPIGIYGKHHETRNSKHLEPESCSFKFKTKKRKKFFWRKRQSYKRCPGWDIQTVKNSQMEFWMWFMYTFRKELEELHSKSSDKIPIQWAAKTKDQALQSLESYNIYIV